MANNKGLIAVGAVAVGAVALGGIFLLTRLAEAMKVGLIVDVKWRETGTEEWHPFPLSVPGDTSVDVKWRVRNNSDSRATFTTGIISLDLYRPFPQTLTTIEPGEEADLISEGFEGEKAGTSGSRTFYLAVLPGEVTSPSQPTWYEADLVDSVTIHYSWY